MFGIPYRDEPEFETGQIVVDKARCWRALCLTMWYNEYSDFYYQYVHGDKETFHLAFRKLDQSYAMPATPIYPLDDTMCQHDFEGRRVFQHRNLDKWNLFLPNKPLWDFWHENECRKHIQELRRAWDGRIGVCASGGSGETEVERVARRQLTGTLFDYYRVGHDRRPLGFLPDGTIGVGTAACERLWDVRADDSSVILEISGEEGTICRLRSNENGVWRGKWLKFEETPVGLIPTRSNPHSGPDCSN